MTNAEIIIIANTIAKIKADDRKLPVRLSYALNKNLAALLEAYKPYEESYKDLGIENPDGDLTPEQNDKLGELKLLSVDVDLYKVSLEDILQADLTINELEVIQTYILNDEKEAAGNG